MPHTQSDTLSFFRHAFLRHQPRRYAVMQPKGADRKYSEYSGSLSDNQIKAHLEGRTTYAVPYGHAGLGHLLALDIDAGAPAAVIALLWACEQRGLWAFAQYDEQTSRGYVYVPFDDQTNLERLKLLGDDLIHQVQGDDWQIDNRATEADTRLPLARHRHTGRRGTLVVNGAQLNLDSDPDGALDELISAYQENPTDQLPAPPPKPTNKPAGQQASRPAGPGYSIQDFNRDHDLNDLLTSYGAKLAKGHGRRLFFCPFHDDRNASLSVYRNREGKTVCHCKSTHSGCKLSQRHGDAFYVYCIGEGLTEQQALRRLNGLPEDPEPKTGPQTPPAAPQTRRTPSGGNKTPPRQQSTPRIEQAPTAKDTAHENPNQPVHFSLADAASNLRDTRPVRGDGGVKSNTRRSTPIHPATQEEKVYGARNTADAQGTRGGHRGIPQRALLLPTDGRGVQYHPDESGDHQATSTRTERTYQAASTQTKISLEATIGEHARKNRQLKPSTRALLEALFSLMDNTGRIWLSVEQYAKAANISERSARYGLRQLEDEGYLIRDRDRSRDRQTNIYALMLPPEGGQKVAPTCNYMHDHVLESSRTSRGGQLDPAPAPQASAPKRADPPQAAAPEAPQVSTEPDATGCYQGPAGAVAYASGVAYVPPEAEAWYRQLVEAGAIQIQQPPTPVAEPLPPEPEPPPVRYGPPQDEAKRRKYFALLGKARKANSPKQRRYLETQARWLEEPLPARAEPARPATLGERVTRPPAQPGRRTPEPAQLGMFDPAEILINRQPADQLRESRTRRRGQLPPLLAP